MNILSHIGDAIATTNAVEVETDGMLAFFGQAGGSTQPMRGATYNQWQRRRARARRGR